MTDIQQTIIKQLGLEDLPAEDQISLINQMTEAVLKRITISILEKLSEEEQDDFNKLADQEDPEKMEEFLKSKVENYEQMVEQIAKDFITEMKENIEEAK